MEPWEVLEALEKVRTGDWRTGDCVTPLDEFVEVELLESVEELLLSKEFFFSFLRLARGAADTSCRRNPSRVA